MQSSRHRPAQAARSALYTRQEADLRDAFKSRRRNGVIAAVVFLGVNLLLLVGLLPALHTTLDAEIEAITVLPPVKAP